MKEGQSTGTPDPSAVSCGAAQLLSLWCFTEEGFPCSEMVWELHFLEHYWKEANSTILDQGYFKKQSPGYSCYTPRMSVKEKLWFKDSLVQILLPVILQLSPLLKILSALGLKASSVECSKDLKETPSSPLQVWITYIIIFGAILIVSKYWTATLSAIFIFWFPSTATWPWVVDDASFAPVSSVYRWRLYL